MFAKFYRFLTVEEFTDSTRLVWFTPFTGLTAGRVICRTFSYTVGYFAVLLYRVSNDERKKKVNRVYLGQVLKTELTRLVMEEALCVCPRSVTGTWKNHLLVVRAHLLL